MHSLSLSCSIYHKYTSSIYCVPSENQNKHLPLGRRQLGMRRSQDAQLNVNFR